MGGDARIASIQGGPSISYHLIRHAGTTFPSDFRFEAVTYERRDLPVAILHWVEAMLPADLRTATILTVNGGKTKDFHWIRLSLQENAHV